MKTEIPPKGVTARWVSRRITRSPESRAVISCGTGLSEVFASTPLYRRHLRSEYSSASEFRLIRNRHRKRVIAGRNTVCQLHIGKPGTARQGRQNRAKQGQNRGQNRDSLNRAISPRFLCPRPHFFSICPVAARVYCRACPAMSLGGASAGGCLV